MTTEGEAIVRTCIEAPERAYATIPTPEKMRIDTSWPVPAPEVIRVALGNPLRGLWIDHVPTGAEIAASGLQCVRNPENAWKNPLATGDWSGYRYIWMKGHPETMSPQTTMPDAWFDHPGARKPPPPIEGYTAQSGRTVQLIVGSAMSGSAYKHDARELPALWRNGLLRTPEERMLAEQVIKNAPYAPDEIWYRMVLDEGWTIRRAAQILREAGICVGSICAWTNRWARAPEGTPPEGSGPAEEPWDIHLRCRSQVAERGPWPLSRTERAARKERYRRVQ